jgi:hypothetical protein
LSNPQQLNAYSYALDNPIVREDPSGTLSIQATIIALLTNAVALLTQEIALLTASNAHSGTTPASSALFNRSLSLNPGPVTITPSNQSQYGTITNEISNNAAFQQFIGDQVKAQKGKKINESNLPYEFKSGDLHTAIHKADNVRISGTESENGTWNLNVTVQKYYTFNPHGAGYYENEPTVTTENNVGYAEQKEGIIRPYNINITFPYTYTPQ